MVWDLNEKNSIDRQAVLYIELDNALATKPDQHGWNINTANFG